MPARKKPDDLKKSARILVRVTKALKQDVNEMADATNQSISEMVEQDLEKRVGKWRGKIEKPSK